MEAGVLAAGPGDIVVAAAAGSPGTVHHIPAVEPSAAAELGNHIWDSLYNQEVSLFHTSDISYKHAPFCLVHRVSEYKKQSHTPPNTVRVIYPGIK